MGFSSAIIGIFISHNASANAMESACSCSRPLNHLAPATVSRVHGGWNMAKSHRRDLATSIASPTIWNGLPSSAGTMSNSSRLHAPTSEMQPRTISAPLTPVIPFTFCLMVHRFGLPCSNPCIEHPMTQQTSFPFMFRRVPSQDRQVATASASPPAPSSDPTGTPSIGSTSADTDPGTRRSTLDGFLHSTASFLSLSQ